MFRRILCIELRKAFGNKWFLMALLLGCALAAVSFATELEMDLRCRPFMTIDFISKKYNPPSSLSVFPYWIVNNMGGVPSTDLYFLLLPLLATIPYSWSLLSERVGGYANQIIARSSRTHYLVAKTFATFLAGGAVVTIPLLLNFIACMCIAPFDVPDVVSVVMFGVYEESLWSWFFYNTPGLYCLFRTVLIFLFSGIWASFVMSLAFLLKKRIPLLIVPYLSLILLKFLNDKMIVPLSGVRQDITPFGFLRSIPPMWFTSGWVIAAEIGILVLIIGIILFKNRKADVL